MENKIEFKEFKKAQKYKINSQLFDVIVQMCDISLKTGGLRNKQGVDMVLNSFEIEDNINKEVKELEDGKRTELREASK